METRELTCICCPLGCSLTATMEQSGEITVTGNTCPRGAEYAKTEWLDPRRVVTSTVVVTGQKEGEEAMVSVKTKQAIPKDKMMDCIRELADVSLKAPVRIGDVVITNVAGTGVDVIATKDIG
ncbi:MAG: DUF1667 domain-containing protein [Lachnospiraceae bacterium]|nr:DUF1667 domain-containing protein [Lachnospiraceae bacterium]